MKRRRPGLRQGRFLFFILLIFAGVIALSAGPAWARLGGGQSYGGGHSSSGGSGGAGDIIDMILLVVYLIRLLIEYPIAGLIVLGLIVGFFLIAFIKDKIGGKHQRFESAKNEAFVKRDQHRTKEAAISDGLNRLLESDPNFSDIIFLDFTHLIYTRYMEALGNGMDPKALTPYLEANLLTDLTTRRQTNRIIEDVIIGSSELGAPHLEGDRWKILVDLETNYVERAADDKGPGKAWYTRVKLILSRRQGVVSKGPESTRSLQCPKCGSPVKIDNTGACAYCNTLTKPGEFAWELERVIERERTLREQVPLTLGGEEVGTNIPTMYADDLDVQRKAFNLLYPDFDWNQFEQRARALFLDLQKAWSEKNPEALRPFETDRLFQQHLFWIERYRAKGYTNHLENTAVSRIEIVKIKRDAFLDRITVRIAASMNDYTTDAGGKVIDGGKSKTRRFTEYWTFIRKAGFTAKEPLTPEAHSGPSCPSCGASFKVSMSGICDYCGSHVTGGEFDWTLAKIEQDESYTPD